MRRGCSSTRSASPGGRAAAAMAERRWIAWARTGTTVVAVVFAWGFLLSYFKPSLLFLDTTIAGGDTPSFLRPIHHLRDTLLPAGMPQGWDLGNFCGYAPYQFYFLPPSLTIVALSSVIPLNVAFKLVTVIGSFLLPLMTTLGFATSINWKWHFASWQDLMPKIFWPAAAVAALDVLWMAVFRRPTDRPGRYLLFGAVVTTLCFFNGTAVGLPEIRFVPC